MKEFFKWFSDNPELSNKPWLILGKGPSFAKYNQFNLNDYHLLSLNHVVREMPVKMAHIIDLDVFEDCAEAILNNAEYLIMPWFPHINNRARNRTLSEHCNKHSTLQQLSNSGRLISYNLSSAVTHHPGWPVVHVKYFSAEAALGLLTGAGVKKIRSLGIDGGNQYSNDFSDLKDKTLLANNRNTFDEQFQEIARIIFKTGVDFSPLDLPSPIRVFVATTEDQMLSTKVLEYSIKKNSSMSVEVIPLHTTGIEIPLPDKLENRPRTPFSFQRFLIPQLNQYQGRAIYLDSDMQVFHDIKKLWSLPFDGADILAVGEPKETGRKPQFSVMLLNCESLGWDISNIVNNLNEGQLNYETLMYEMGVAKNIKAKIDPAWNSLERYEKGLTSLIHYTDMNTQPWVSKEHPLGYLWFRDLFEAIDAGFITEDYIQNHLKLGYVRPSLGYQVTHKIEDPLLLPGKARQLDKNYKAPFTRLHKHQGSPWIGKHHYLRKFGRRLYKNAFMAGLINLALGLIKFTRRLIRYVRFQ